jgi:hypothetical protein
MKYAYSQFSTVARTARLGFFFNARGGEQERSPLGLYKTLLHQLFLDALQLRNGFEARLRKKKAQVGNRDVTWTLAELREMFHDAIARVRNFRLDVFIDALDECQEDEVRLIVRDFARSAREARAQSSNLNVC